MIQDLIIEESTYKGAFSSGRTINLLEEYGSLKKNFGSEWRTGSQGREALIEQVGKDQKIPHRGSTPTMHLPPPNRTKLHRSVSNRT